MGMFGMQAVVPVAGRESKPAQERRAILGIPEVQRGEEAMKVIYCRVCHEPIVNPDDVVLTDNGTYHSECWEKKKSERKERRVS